MSTAIYFLFWVFLAFLIFGLIFYLLGLLIGWLLWRNRQELAEDIEKQNERLRRQQSQIEKENQRLQEACREAEAKA